MTILYMLDDPHHDVDNDLVIEAERPGKLAIARSLGFFTLRVLGLEACSGLEAPHLLGQAKSLSQDRNDGTIQIIDTLPQIKELIHVNSGWARIAFAHGRRR